MEVSYDLVPQLAQNRSTGAWNSVYQHVPGTKTVLDLPLEVLCACASYLERKDVKNVLLVSKHLNKTLTGELYYAINWSFCKHSCFSRPTSQGRWSGANGHTLAKVLSKYNTLAGNVRHLHLDWGDCWFCHSERSQISPSIATRSPYLAATLFLSNYWRRLRTSKVCTCPRVGIAW